MKKLWLLVCSFLFNFASIIAMMVEPQEYKGLSAQEKFFQAAIHCDKSWLEKFIAMKGVNVNAKYPSANSEWPILYYVLTSANCLPENIIDTVAILLQNGVDPNAADSYYGEIPLIWARYSQPKEVFELLLDSGANPSIKDHSGRTAYDSAPNEDIKNLIKSYMPGGNKKPTYTMMKGPIQEPTKKPVGPTPQEEFFQAAIHCNKPSLEKFIKMPGVDVNAFYPDPSYSRILRPILFFVLTECSDKNTMIDLVKMLLQHGVDPNSKDSIGETPLFWAQYSRQKEIFELLLAAGADPNLKYYGSSLTQIISDQNIIDLIEEYINGTKKPTKVAAQPNLATLRTQLHDLHISLQRLHYTLNRL